MHVAAKGQATLIDPATVPLLGKALHFKATAYSSDVQENGGWGAVDYYGNPLQLGTIAVDPSVVPLGSTVYITGYQAPGLPPEGLMAKATDTGSAIKGNHIDIFMPGSPKQSLDFGKQDVKIYVLPQY
jgi:3D (Asp-Asp-Asp) domain-containing protein